MNNVDAFLRWCHPDLLEERLRHGCACWQVIHALGLDPAAYPAPLAGSLSLLSAAGHQLGISSAGRSTAPPQSEPPLRFSLDPAQAPVWVFAWLKGREAQALDPLDAAQWWFWVVPANQLHPERRSIALQPLQRARGEPVAWEGLKPALANLACGSPWLDL